MPQEYQVSPDLYDYRLWPNFSKQELICQETHLENPHVVEFTKLMNMVQILRGKVGCPFRVTSAYRAPIHSIERRKASVGQHTVAAIDIQVENRYYQDLIREALNMGVFTGIGFNLKGPHNQRFVHLDMRDIPATWTY